MPSTQATRVGFPLCESETVEGLMKNQSAESGGVEPVSCQGLTNPPRV